MGFGKGYLKGPRQGLAQHGIEEKQRDAIGNAFNVRVVRRVLVNILIVAGLFSSGTASNVPTLATNAWPHPMHPSILVDFRDRTDVIADSYTDLIAPFEGTMKTRGGIPEIIGLGPSVGVRYANRAVLSTQSATFVSKSGAPPLLPPELNKEDHVKAAQLLTHPFDESPQPPDDMAFAWKAAIHQEGVIAWREHYVGAEVLQIGVGL